MWPLFIVNLVTYTQDQNAGAALGGVGRAAIAEVHAVHGESVVLRRRPEKAGSR